MKLEISFYLVLGSNNSYISNATFTCNSFGSSYCEFLQKVNFDKGIISTLFYSFKFDLKDGFINIDIIFYRVDAHWSSQRSSEGDLKYVTLFTIGGGDKDMQVTLKEIITLIRREKR